MTPSGKDAVAPSLNSGIANLPVDLPDGLCLVAYRGSIAHGMYVPSTDENSIDDVDLMGVVLAPETHYLGLREWGSRGTQELKQGQYDCVWYEIRKMISLLLQGNPNVLSLLWTRPEHRLFCNEAGQMLVENRRIFAGKHVYDAFAGYADGQLERMEARDPEELRLYIAVDREMKYRGMHPNHVGESFERREPVTGEERDSVNWTDERLRAAWRSYHKKGENLGYLGDKRKQLVLQHGYDAKNAAHCIRLLRMCKEFLATGELCVFREHDATELLEIKRGQWPLDRVKQHAKELFEAIGEARDKSPLPPGPDREAAEKMLVRILRAHLL